MASLKSHTETSYFFFTPTLLWPGWFRAKGRPHSSLYCGDYPGGGPMEPAVRVCLASFISELLGVHSTGINTYGKVDTTPIFIRKLALNPRLNLIKDSDKKITSIPRDFRVAAGAAPRARQPCGPRCGARRRCLVALVCAPRRALSNFSFALARSVAAPPARARRFGSREISVADCVRSGLRACHLCRPGRAGMPPRMGSANDLAKLDSDAWKRNSSYTNLVSALPSLVGHRSTPERPWYHPPDKLERSSSWMLAHEGRANAIALAGWRLDDLRAPDAGQSTGAN
ncbi:hypothetical protein T492DRAFT_1122363 [Pavlovales sp. CCMP2436]|nr:hypothetical protein T492DRAFT_1122363 [Pavlovales sp. CCMP2436]